jgi:hypothetical protein
MLRVHGDKPLEFRAMTWMSPDKDSFDPFETVYPNNDHRWGVTAWTPNDTVHTRWTTNSTSKSSYIVRSDSLPLIIPYNDEEHILSYDTIDIRTGTDFPWANWGVLYQHHFFITNNSRKPQTFAYYIEAPLGRNQYIGTYSPLNSPAYRSLRFSDINNWLDVDQMVVEITVNPGESALMPAEFVLGGQSYELVGHYVVMRGPVTFDLPERRVFSAVEGESPPEPHNVTVRNTSGAALNASVRLTGKNPEAFIVDKGNLSISNHGDADTFAVAVADGLAPGTYEADAEVMDGLVLLDSFPVYVTVSARGVYDYLTLLPNDAWRIHTGDTVVEIEHGSQNIHGIPSLIFSNTAGRWPSASGELLWGTGVRFAQSEWDRIFLEYDITVRDHASISLLSEGPSLPQHRVPLSNVIAENNKYSEGGVAGHDLRRGRYAGRVSLADIMRERGSMAEFSGYRMEAFFKDGWRVFAIGGTPATVTVDVFRLVREP